MNARSRALACTLAIAADTDAFACAESRPVDARVVAADALVAPADAIATPACAAAHVPPAAPAATMPEMDKRAMSAAMQMDDDATLVALRVDRLEHVIGDADARWKVDSTIGGDFDKLALRSEGAVARGAVDDGDVELLWRHAAAAFWDTSLGVRRDVGRGAARSWVAFGVQGLAPYWIEVEATAYVGYRGRTALRLELAHDVRLTQRLVVQPRIELDAYGRDDARAHVGAGVAATTVALALRYEVARELAPYVGVERNVSYGVAADAARADGVAARETVWVVGLRLRY